MKTSRRILECCSILILISAQSSWGGANNIPHSEVVCGISSQPLQGVDVSVYQAKSNWTTVANTGPGFAFIKATEGVSAPNTAFSKEWPAAGTAGLLRSAYHYFIPTDDPIKQANFFLKTVGTLADYDLPPMMDLEITNGVAPKTVVARAKQFLDYVEQQTGRTPIIYTNAYFFSTLGNPDGWDRYPLYVSDYGVKCPKVPAPWKSWTFWQYSGTGTTAGVPGKVDLDVFDGVMNDLIALITKAVPDGVQPPNPTGEQFQAADPDQPQ